MYLSCKSLLFFMCDVAPFLPRWPVEAAVGSSQSWPDLCHPGQDLPHQLAAPEVCSSLYYLMWSETLTANLWEKEKKNRSWNRQLETTVREQITWPKSYLLIRVRKRRFLLCALYLSQPLNKTPKEFFHRVCWLAGGCRVRDYIADEVFPGLNSHPEGLS